jgi:hypothetical protein
MAVGTADVRAVVVTARAGLEDQVVPAWTGWRAEALRQALRMTNESYADYLKVSARTVAYWKERPDTVPKQRMQSVLDSGLGRASDQAKALFTRLTAEARRTPGVESSSAQQAAQFEPARDAVGSPADSGHPVALLDDLIGADIADRGDVARASWLPGAAPTVITGYLFSVPSWHHEGVPLIAAPSTAAARIRAVAQHLMDIDFQFGGGYVRRMLLCRRSCNSPALRG